MAGRDCALKQKGISKKKKKKSVILYHDHFSQVLYYLPLFAEKTSTLRCSITASLAVMVENTL